MNTNRLLNANDKPKDSKVVNFLMGVYMASVLLFTQYDTLNRISLTIFAITFSICALFILVHGKNFRFDPYIISLTCFLGFCFLSLVWAPDFPSAREDVVTVAILLVMSVIIYSYISIYRNIDAFIKALFISGLVCAYVVIGFYGIVDYLLLMVQGERLGEGIANVNTIGIYMAITVIVSFYYGYIKKKQLAFIAMLLPLLVGFGTGSRKALVMMVLGIGLIMLMQYREDVNAKSFGKLFIAFFAVIAFVYWITTLPLAQGAIERIMEMLGRGVKTDTSTSIRAAMRKIGWRYFLAHPLTGIGIGNTWIIALGSMGLNTYLHNNFIDLLAGVGLIGTALYYSMYVYLLKELYRISVKQKNDAATLMFVIVLVLLIMDYGMVSYYSKMTYIYLSMAAGAISIGKYNEKKAKEEELSSEGNPEKD